MKKIILSLFLMITSVMLVKAQDKPCITDSMWNEAVKADPSIAIRHAQLQQFTKDYTGPAQRVVTAGGGILYRIPVVFHVIHTYGIENISKAQIEDAVRILNLSYQKLNPDTVDVIPLFQPIFADCQIEFVLANVDPDGNCTDGITRTYSKLTETASDNVKALVDWPNDQYLNIWVVKVIASGAAGYAYYPGISAGVDGVVILHDYIGGIGTSNGSNYSERSLAHEVGHWLNLPHTWGNSNTPGLASNCNIDDGIQDTPNTKGIIGGCNTSLNSCGTIANVQNYMDYAACHKMFTEGQKSVMHAALNGAAGSRFNLYDQANLVLTGTETGHTLQTCAPIADFTNRVYSVCAGTTINFSDKSWNGDVTARVWSFPGGLPSTDTAATTAITYNTIGTYDVSIIVSNGSGADTLIRTAMINVLPNTGTGSVPTVESFETITIPGNDWVVENTAPTTSWNITALAAVTGTKSIRLVNQSGNPAGAVDAFITPTYDLTNLSAAQVTFKLAFAVKSTTDSSSLKVFVSTDCGLNWVQRYLKANANLRTTTTTTSGAYIPAPADWRSETVSLTSAQFSNKPSVRLKFEFTNDLGNNIYIDDINITGIVGINEILADQYSFLAWPNPASSQLNIKMDRPKSVSVKLELFDMTGRKVEETTPSDAASGIFEQTLQNKSYSGMYMLRITAGSDTFQQLIVFN
ncbi:hypothetical protein BH11BAC2_BH11BAC2_21700 [soil metagenome]